MVGKVLCVSALAGAIATAAVSWGQEAGRPQVEATDNVPAGGGIYAEFNMALPDEAIAMVAKQAGVELVAPGNAVWANAEPITLKVDDGYFWPTLIEMCKQAKVRFMPEPGPGGRNHIRITDGRAADPFAEL